MDLATWRKLARLPLRLVHDSGSKDKVGLYVNVYITWLSVDNNYVNVLNPLCNAQHMADCMHSLK